MGVGIFHVGVGIFHRPLLKTARDHQYIVPNVSSKPLILPLQCKPTQMAKFVQEEYIL
jgi:hypothetical protein